jgi:hypothetical protein
MSGYVQQLPFKQRAKKALVAAWSAGAAASLATFGASLATEVPRTRDGWLAIGGAAIGVGIGAALVAGRATYNTRNAGTVNGSEPPAASGSVHGGHL